MKVIALKQRRMPAALVLAWWVAASTAVLFAAISHAKDARVGGEQRPLAPVPVGAAPSGVGGSCGEGGFPDLMPQPLIEPMIREAPRVYRV